MADSIEPQSRTASPIGRDHEQRVLSSAFESTRSGHGKLILVGGEAGIGKTTIVEHFISEPSVGEGTVLTGACYDVASPPPYEPWREALSSAQAAGHTGLSSSHWFDEKHMASLQDQTALFNDVQHRLEHIAGADPLVLVLEDLHWADRESLELLRYIGRTLRRIPLLIIATYRNDEITSEHPLYHALPALVREARAERIDLRRFSNLTIREMVDNVYQLEQSDRDRLVDELVRRTEGNPFFIVELLRSMVMADVLYVRDGNWRLAPLSDVEIPLLVRQVIDRRFLQLDEAARSALQTAAVLGYEIRPDIWLTLIDEDEAGLSRIVQQALDHFLLEQSPHGSHLRFRHALVQEALYSSLPLPWRQMQHRRVAETLVDMPDVDPATVAEHFQRAGDARAVGWLLRAARKARQYYAPYTIIQNLDPVIDSTGPLTSDELMEAFQLRGWAHETSGEFDAAHRDFLSELQTAKTANAKHAEWNALIHLAELWAGRDYERAGEYTGQALALAEEIGDHSLKAHCLNRLGNWHLNNEDPDRARAYHEQALGIFESIGDQEGLSATYDLLGMTCYMGGDLIEGTRHYERAIDLFQWQDNRPGLISSLANFSMRGVTYHTDMMTAAPATLDDCVMDAERALTIASEIDYRAGEVYALVRLGSCLGSRGDYQPALNALERAITGAGEISHRQWLTAARCVIGALYLDLMDPLTARHYLDDVRSVAEEIGSRHWIRFDSGIMAMAHLTMGRLEEAAVELRPTWVEEVPTRTMAQRHVWRARIELELAQGDPEQAIQLIDRVMDSTAYASRKRPAIRLSLLRGRALIAMGHFNEAESWLRPARAVARDQGARPLLWRIHRELGILQDAQGDRLGASEEFAEARRLIDETGQALENPDLRSRFLSAAHMQIPEPWRPTPLQYAKQSFSGLTRRQREVAALIAAGCSNREIADALSISERTVESHVTAILSTLSLSSRAQVAAWCVENNLTASPLE